MADGSSDWYPFDSPAMRTAQRVLLGTLVLAGVTTFVLAQLALRSSGLPWPVRIAVTLPALGIAGGLILRQVRHGTRSGVELSAEGLRLLFTGKSHLTVPWSLIEHVRIVELPRLGQEVHLRCVDGEAPRLLQDRAPVPRKVIPESQDTSLHAFPALSPSDPSVITLLHLSLFETRADHFVDELGRYTARYAVSFSKESTGGGGGYGSEGTP